MSHLIGHTLQDLRAGRTSWRVYMLLAIPALIAGVLAGLLPPR